MLINYFLEEKKNAKKEQARASFLISERAELPIFCETKRILCDTFGPLIIYFISLLRL